MAIAGVCICKGGRKNSSFVQQAAVHLACIWLHVLSGGGGGKWQQVHQKLFASSSPVSSELVMVWVATKLQLTASRPCVEGMG